LPKDIEDRLTALAEQTGRSKSFYAREALIEYLEDLEDIALAEKRLQEYRNGEVEATTLADLRREYGLDS
jgi:RHH-type rel operon transcriptional repressor/antitoxin RelB